ncbi:hypothetical protein M5K25_001700 [Dendrobium thyrsiflorum]|uniref:Uncharacterized protein n=1 Tax=Dendrobium thyrsiflorum TaxID=117978 RepID=A0ABD0VR50_DENTH
MSIIFRYRVNTTENRLGIPRCGSHDHHLYALDYKRHLCVSKILCGGSIYGSPAIDKNEVLCNDNLACTCYGDVSKGGIKTKCKFWTGFVAFIDLPFLFLFPCGFSSFSGGYLPPAILVAAVFWVLSRALFPVAVRDGLLPVVVPALCWLLPSGCVLTCSDWVMMKVFTLRKKSLNRLTREQQRYSSEENDKCHSPASAKELVLRWVTKKFLIWKIDYHPSQSGPPSPLELIRLNCRKVHSLETSLST